MRALGVTRISTDRVRGIGRGASTEPTVAELCGHCGRGVAAVTSDGAVRPCVMSRWMTAGSVMDQPLGDILAGAAMRDLVSEIPEPENACNPDCKPKGDGNDCSPAETETCGPSFCSPDTK